MRKIIVEAEVSVDGAMGSDNPDFWKQVFQFHSQDVQAYLNNLLFMPDALLMGQRTYQSFSAVWPTRQGEDADRINRIQRGDSTDHRPYPPVVSRLTPRFRDGRDGMIQLDMERGIVDSHASRPTAGEIISKGAAHGKGNIQ